MATKTNSGLLAYAKAQVGLPYWYGCYGQTANASLYGAKKKAYPSYYTASDFSSQYGKRVHDCSGLVKGYLWSDTATSTPKYNSAQDKSAAGLYAAASEKGKISTFPKHAGQLLFKGSSASAITHVGVYGGDGYVYEAKSHSTGVVRSVYNASGWNFWCQCPYCTDDTGSTSSSGSTATTGTSTGAGASSTADPETIWNYLIGKIGNAFGVAGLMGNLYAESALIPNNLQNAYENKLGYTDETYTAAVDNGTYTKFSSDSAGYGLAQWTYSTRKKALLEYCQSKGASIGNLTAQLEFLYKELSESYKTVLSTLKSATSVKAASDFVLTKYEIPADQSDSVKTKRAGYGQTYYDKYAGTSSSGSSASSGSSSSGSSSVTVEYAASKESGHSKGTTKTTTAALRLRTGAGTNKTIIKVLAKGSKVTWYGYYTMVSGVKWYLVVDSTGQTGFMSSQYLK